MRLHELRSYYSYDSLDQILLELTDYEKKKIVEYYESDAPFIFRGMRDTGTYIKGDGRNLNRKSANTRNYITLLTEILPSWELWPQRSKSFICSTDISYAQGYGTIYHVIPLEHQPIAYCKNVADFFDAFPFEKYFPHREMHIGRFNIHLHDLSMDYRIELDENDPHVFFENLKELCRQVKKHEYPTINPLSKPIYKYGIKMFIDLFDPNHKCVLAPNYKSMEMHMGETWLSGKVLFVNEDHFGTLVEKLK